MAASVGLRVKPQGRVVFPCFLTLPVPEVSDWSQRLSVLRGSERRGAMSQPVNHTHSELLTHSIDLPFPNWKAAAGIFSSPTLAANHTRMHTHAVCPILWCVKSARPSERNTNRFSLHLLIALWEHDGALMSDVSFRAKQPRRSGESKEKQKRRAKQGWGWKHLTGFYRLLAHWWSRAASCFVRINMEMETIPNMTNKFAFFMFFYIYFIFLY